MKSLLINFLFNALLLNSSSFNLNEITAEAVVLAIANEDFTLVNEAFDKRLLNPNEIYNGKPLLLHAIDQDNAEMVRLLISRGARLNYVDAAGYNPKEYARMHNKIYALAEIIVITA